MKKVLLVMGLVLSATAFADSGNLLDELRALDAEYQNLSSQEQARFDQEKAQADAAQEALTKNENLYAQLTARANKLSAEADTKFYKDQYEELAKKYENALKELNEEMDGQKKVIQDFQKIEQLRAN